MPQGGTRTSTPRSEPGALVMAIPPSSSRPHTVPSFTLPVSSSFTITSTSRISQVPPSTPPLLSDNSGECSSSIKVSSHLSRSPRSPSHTSEENGDSSCIQASNNESCESFNPATITPEKLLPEHHPQYNGEILCGRPFCKLKKREHYHCQLCNQAFSEQEKLGPHLQKHMSGSGFVGKEEEPDQPMESDDDRSNHSPNNTSDRPPSPKSPITNYSQASQIPPFSIGVSSSQTSPHFPNPHMYTQAPGFPGFPSPFTHPLQMASIFPPGSLPRLLPPTVWPGVHPALAAMAHPALMMAAPRPNGDLPPLPSSEAQSSLGPPPSMGHPSGLSSPRDLGTLLPPSLGTSPHLALLGKRVGTDDFASQESKKIRPASHAVRLLKDEPVPEGYYRFR